MIRKITVEKIGPISKPVSIDFSYKNYNTKASKPDDIIDEQKQVWIQNKLSTVKVLLGKNGTGKSSFMQWFSNIESFLTDLFRVGFYIPFRVNKDLFELTNKNNIAGYNNFAHEYISVLSFSDDFNDDFEGSQMLFKISKETKKVIDNNSLLSLVYNKIMEFVDTVYQESFSETIGSSVKIFEDDGEEYAFTFYDKDLKASYTPSDEGDHESSWVIEEIKDKLQDCISFDPNDNSILRLDVNRIFRTAEECFFGIEYNFDFVDIKSRYFENGLNIYEIKPVMLGEVKETDKTEDSLVANIARFGDLFGQEYLLTLLKTIDPQIVDISVRNNNDYDTIVEIYIKGQRMPISPKKLSSGTKQFITIMNSVATTLKSGTVLFVDELENGLQLRIVKMIIDMFSDENLNTKGAQLVFTTHNIMFLMLGYIDIKNHIITHRDEEGIIQFTDMFSLLNKSAGKDVTRFEKSNISYYKEYLDESIFETYPFMMTNKERRLLVNKFADIIGDDNGE